MVNGQMVNSMVNGQMVNNMTTSEQKEHIAGLFDRIAGSYDLLNHLLSFHIDRLWRRRLARRLRPVDHLLDVAIGTADVAIEIMRQKKANRITGIDLSDEMMRIGADKVARKGYAVQFEHVNAQEMKYADNSFDAVTCGFGTRNFSDLDKGLSEMYRVLRPEGQLLILEFSYPENRIIRALYNLFFSHILPAVGGAISHDKTAYRYLNKSVENFIWGEQYCNRLRQAGFSDVGFQPLTFGIATLYFANKQAAPIS